MDKYEKEYWLEFQKEGQQWMAGLAKQQLIARRDVVLEQPIKWPAVELVGPSKGLGPVMQRQLWYALVVALAWVVMIGFAAKAELDLFGF